jgi:signal transduction histidine kinase
MKSVNQKIFFINLIVVMAALMVWRTTSSIEMLSLSPEMSAGSEVKSSLLIGFGLLLMLVLLVQIYLHRTITKPLRRLAKDLRIRAYSGKLDPVVIDGHDEIAQLADLFNDLQKKIKHQVSDLKCFAENVCHEIRTPLASIVSSIEYMEKKKIYNEDLALVIRNEAMRLGTIASALLEATSDIGMLNKTNISCEELFSKAVDSNGLGNRVKLSTSGFRKTVSIDGVLMRQVFENLLSNAKKFSTEKTIIHAHFAYLEGVSDRYKGSLVFTLANEGPCLPDDQLSRVFDRFFAINHQNDTKGYGIGLSLCRDIIEAHTGNIRMENLATGGVIVAVELPC